MSVFSWPRYTKYEPILVYPNSIHLSIFMEKEEILDTLKRVNKFFKTDNYTVDKIVFICNRDLDSIVG